MTFQDYKEKVTIASVAESLGYRHDLKKGKNILEFKHADGDTVLIDPVKKLYFNRDGTNDRGDVIAFVKNRLARFNISFQHEINGVNKILQSYANEAPKLAVTYLEPALNSFNSLRYTASKPTSPQLHYLTQERGLDPETVKHFLPFIHLVRDTHKTTGKPYENIAFALTKPGSEALLGWDLKNYGFKGVAAGSDRKNGMWIADFVGTPSRTKNVIFGESPIDLMSFYQLHKHKLDLDNAAFVSFGGGISKSQLQGAINYWTDTKKHTAFDNDYQGKLYDIALAVQVNGINIPLPEKKANSLLFKIDGQQIEIPTDKINLKAFEAATGIKSGITVHKATGQRNGVPFKDFNDIIHPKNRVEIPKKKAISY